MVGMRDGGENRALVNVELGAGDVLATRAMDVELVFASQAEEGEIGLEIIGIETEVDEGGNGHVAADAGETIEEEGRHFTKNG